MRVVRECAACGVSFERVETGLLLPEALARDLFQRARFCDVCLAILADPTKSDDIGVRATAELLEHVFVEGWRAGLDAANTQIVEGPLKELRGTHLGMLDTWRRRLALSCEAIIRGLRHKNPLDNR